MDESVEEQKRCPVCGSTSISRDETTGAVFCLRCGTILDETALDFKPPPTFDEAGHYVKLRPVDSIVEERERKIFEAFKSVLSNYSYRLNIPDYIKNTALNFFLRLLEKQKKIFSDSVKFFAAALLYLAAKEHNYPLSYKTIRKTLNIPSEKLSKAIRISLEVLHLRPKKIDPIIYLQQVVEKLKINDYEAIQVAKKLIKIAEARGMLSGKDVRGVVGGVLYVIVKAFGIRRTQREIARACGITEVTIRNRFLEFASLFEELTNIKVELRKKTVKKRIKVKI
ncbi:MAG: TFIIB-type zinc ribbon-containing protein [Candidatus Njordarchaeota archaeon]